MEPFLFCFFHTGCAHVRVHPREVRGGWSLATFLPVSTLFFRCILCIRTVRDCVTMGGDAGAVMVCTGQRTARRVHSVLSPFCEFQGLKLGCQDVRPAISPPFRPAI